METRYEKTVRAIRLVMDAIYDTVKEAGDMGAPSGVLYAAVMHFGVSLDTYNSIIAQMMKQGWIRQSNHVLYALEKPTVSAS